MEAVLGEKKITELTFKKNGKQTVLGAETKEYEAQ